MISLDEALTIIEDRVQTIPEMDMLFLPHSLGRIAARDITAPKSLPPFTNTGVDGYAYCDDGTHKFRLVGASYAGEPFKGTLNKGEAVRIATGAVLPEGADTVAMQEVCDIRNDAIIINELPDKGSNIRLAGQDIAKGEIAVSKGKKLTVQDIAMLGALGVTHIPVNRSLRIAVASTGMELASSETENDVGTITDTNTLMLTQMLTSPNIQITSLASIPDDYDMTYATLKNAAQTHDIVITTGGVSVGDRDFIKDVLHDHGQVLFWKIALRPGKPVLVAMIGACVFIGLPGNPVSAFVTCQLIAKAVIFALNGQSTCLPDGFSVPIANDITKPDHLRCFMRAVFRDDQLHISSDQGSNLYSSLTKATGLVDLPVGTSNFKKGDKVIYRPFCQFE